MKKKSLKVSEIREKSFILGIDIGGSSVKIGHYDLKANEFIGGETFSFGAQKTVSGFISKLRNAILAYLTYHVKGYPTKRCLIGVGIGCPGPLNPKTGVVINPPNIPLRNFNFLDWIKDFILTRDVFILNDADAAAIGEYSVCNKQKIRNMIFLTLGTGVGSGIIINGELYRGAGQGGEIGHMIVNANGKMCTCGRRGCLETYVNKKAITDLMNYGERTPFSIQEIKKILEKDSHPENPTARDVIETITKHLSIGINNLITIFQPDRIVLGGGLMDIFGDQIMSQLLKIYTEYVKGNNFIGSFIRSGFEISAAKLGNNAGWRGAIEYVKKQMSRLRADEGVYE